MSKGILHGPLFVPLKSVSDEMCLLVLISLCCVPACLGPNECAAIGCDHQSIVYFCRWRESAGAVICQRLFNGHSIRKSRRHSCASISSPSFPRGSRRWFSRDHLFSQCHRSSPRVGSNARSGFSGLQRHSDVRRTKSLWMRRTRPIDGGSPRERHRTDEERRQEGRSEESL